MVGSLFPSGKGVFVCNRWGWVSTNSKLFVLVMPPTLRVFIRVPPSVIHTKEDTKLISGKEVQKTSELVPDPSEVQVSAQVSCHCPFLLDMEHNRTAVLLRASRGYCSTINKMQTQFWVLDCVNLWCAVLDFRRVTCNGMLPTEPLLTALTLPRRIKDHSEYRLFSQDTVFSLNFLGEELVFQYSFLFCSLLSDNIIKVASLAYAGFFREHTNFVYITVFSLFASALMKFAFISVNKNQCFANFLFKDTMHPW